VFWASAGVIEHQRFLRGEISVIQREVSIFSGGFPGRGDGASASGGVAFVDEYGCVTEGEHEDGGGWAAGSWWRIWHIASIMRAQGVFRARGLLRIKQHEKKQTTTSSNKWRDEKTAIGTLKQTRGKR